jgi:hypothetical protein
MNRKTWLHTALAAALLLAAPVRAIQNYSCDFETAESRARWTLNPTANPNIYENLTNKWYIGAPGNNDKTGAYGLFISDDYGLSAHYANNGCWNFAYDTIALDHLTSGDYTLSFDYCAMGNMASNFDGIYALWIPMTDPDTGDSVKVFSIATSSGIPPAYENYLIPLQPKALIDYVNGTQTWKQCVATIPNKKCDGTLHYLAFVWANTTNQTQQPGAMIDNILVLDTRPCDAPEKLTLDITGTTTTLSWTGTTSSYEVTAYSYETDTWYGPKIVNGTSTSFSGLPIGQTDFIVRAVCAEDLYSLKTSISKLVYYPDQMCVDYLNLDKAKCYINKSNPNSTISFSDFQQVKPVDEGPSQIESRHTIHFDKSEREPRTGGMAKTIPDGELASVRLGNWKNGNQAERIEFSFQVDTIDYPVLLLKYMPILEAPGHSDKENPRFKLDILIGGKSIGECGQADFNCNDVYKSGSLLPGAEKQGWHITPKDVAQTSADVVWKEWTTVGVNLKKPEYQGKTLTVRLTTHDCTAGAHCGYAYFTLSCSDGKLKGMKCGEINPVFEAPDGFVYRWAYAYNERYREPDGYLPEQYVLGHEQTYEAGLKDDSLYVVDCMFVQDSSCFFSLYASTLATNPIAEMNAPQIIKNCREDIYKVQFDASPSWVQEIDHVTEDTLVSRIYHIDYYEWNVDGLTGGWSDQVSPIFDFPRKGGDYTVSLRTTCGICDSTIYYQLHLDSLGPTYETRTVYLCDELRKTTGYIWPEKPDTAYFDYGLDSVVLLNEATSCDSVIYLELLEPERIFVDTVVLPEHLPFYYRGRTYDHTMIDTIPNEDCDTAWTLNFEVYESLLAHMPDSAYVLCEDGTPAFEIVYQITRGRSLRYSYAFDDPELPQIEPVQEMQRKGLDTLLVNISAMPYPNVYKGKLFLEDSLPKFNVTIPFTLTVQYASSVITQRWNDVLAIRNDDYNGGYTFDAVQWYMDGEPIPDATSFNYYAGDGQTLGFNGEEYTALLTRSDGVKLFTCAFMPTEVPAAIIDMPSLVPLSASVHVAGKGNACWYDMLGRPHKSEAYDNSDITAPSVAGYYLLVLRSESARSIHSMMVR